MSSISDMNVRSGWRLTGDMYAISIREKLTRIVDILPTVLPRNRYAADNYFASIWWIYAIIMGFQEGEMTSFEHTAERERFQEYIDFEETRIHNNLEKIKYHIDASDTLTLVVGHGRLEKVTSSLSLQLTHC